MRRRRSRNRSESNAVSNPLGKLPGLVLFLALALPAAEWGAEILLSRMGPVESARPVLFSDKDLEVLYQTDQPAKLREMLALRRTIADAVPAPFVEYRAAAYENDMVGVGPDGLRRGVQGDSGPHVAVFGGDAVFAAHLADDQTIVSATSKALTAASLPAQVVNYGQPGWHSTQWRIAFAQMLASGRKPDIAVFAAGMDDFMTCGDPDKSAWSARLAEAVRRPDLSDLLAQTALARLSRRLGGAAEPDFIAPRPDPACAADSQVDRSIARLAANRAMIAAMGREFGVKTLFVQLPVSVFHYDNAKRAVPVDAKHMEPYIAVAKGYARLNEQHAQADQPGAADRLWLAEFEPEDGQAYVGEVDYTPGFAALIGGRIAGRIAQMLRPPEPAAPTMPEPAPNSPQ